MTEGLANTWTHGLITCARRGGPGGRPCPCHLCRPVLLRWQRDRSMKYRDRRRRAVAAAHPELYPHSCEHCGTPIKDLIGLQNHELACTF